jgi:hypothetical protein
VNAHDHENIKTKLVDWPKPLAEEAYYGAVGAYTKLVEPHTEADPVAVLTQTLCAIGNVVGRSQVFKVDGALHRVNLFLLVIGNTSKGRKGTSYGYTESIMERVSPEWAKNCNASGCSSGEGLIERIRDEVRSEKDPTEIVKHAATDKRLFVLESEFSTVLKQSQREGNILTGIIRDAWDGNRPLRTLTANPRTASNGHLSMVGHITKSELLRLLNQTEIANGMANRYIPILVRRSKVLPDGGNFDPSDADLFVEHLKSVVEFCKKDRVWTRSESAKKLWHKVYPTLSEGKPGLLGSVLGRAEAQVTRLALLYAVIDMATCIEEEHLLAALELWRYAEDSARNVFGESIGDPVADEVLNALKGGDWGLTRKQISHDLFKRNKTRAEIERALNDLRSQGLAHCVYEDQPHGGKKVERWLAGTTYDLRPEAVTA